MNLHNVPDRALGRPMSNIFSVYPEDHIFGDISGVIGDTLQIASNQDRSESLIYELRIRADQRCH